MFALKASLGRIRAFRRDDRGGAAVEFALLAPLLFFTLLSLVELGVLGLLSSTLDDAVIDASRRIRTGRADSASSASTFEDQICASMGGAAASCRDRLVVSVQKFSAFSSAAAAGSTRPAGQFNKGAAGDIIIVKADYKWPLITPFVATGYERTGPLDVTIASRVAFKNEPFE